MRYWAYIGGMMLGPFARDELLVLPGFDGDTPLCPENLAGDAPTDWARASDIPGFPPAEDWPPRRETASQQSLIIGAQGKFERLEGTIRRLESEKTVKDNMIAAQRVELLRLSNELRAAKADLRLAEKATRSQLEALLREERARQQGGIRTQLGELLREERVAQEKAVRRIAEDSSAKDRWVASLMENVERLKAKLEDVMLELERPAAPPPLPPEPPAPEAQPPVEKSAPVEEPPVLQVPPAPEEPPPFADTTSPSS